MSRNAPPHDAPVHEPFTARLLLTVRTVILSLLLVALVLAAADVVLLIFAGVLLAVFLRSAGDGIAAHTPLSPGWGVLLFVAGSTLVLAGAASLIIPHAAGQVDELGTQISQAVSSLESTLEEQSWGRQILTLFPDAGDMQGQAGGAFEKARGVFSSTFGALGSLFVVLFIGFYLAAKPANNVRGVVRLFPRHRRDRVLEILRELKDTLGRWVLGRLFGLVVVGLLTWIGLLILDIPLALTLALMAAGLTFIPNIGPVISVIPPALLALVQDPQRALWVLALYWGIQAVESNLLTPLVDKRTVSLSPVLTIVVQILMGAFLGLLGLILAGPAAVVLMVTVKMTYIEDVLEDHGDAADEGAPAAASG